MRLRGESEERKDCGGGGRLRSGFTVNLTHELSWNIRKGCCWRGAWNCDILGKGGHLKERYRSRLGALRKSKSSEIRGFYQSFSTLC